MMILTSAALGRARLVGLLAILCLGACAGAQRKAAPPEMFGTAVPVGFSADVRYVGSDRRYFVAHKEETEARIRMAMGDGPLNVLALSGGGAGGSFGAGALVGLSHAGKRPQFAVVTGVSTGALLAPFAFLGPSWDEALTEAFGGTSTEHLLRSRSIGILFGPGIYQGKPLQEVVARFATDAMLEAIAQEFKKGRMLLVATTDLDKEETVIWDMGAIAAHGGPAARALFCQVLVASASIPGLFPPVVIHVEDGGKSYDEMHVDGGTTVPFFLGSELVYVMPLEFEKLEGANLYVIVNGQFSAVPRTTPVKTTAVLRRSFTAALTRMSRTALELSAGFAQRYKMRFQFVLIPDDYPYEGPLKMRPSATQALFRFGERCGERGLLWTDIATSMERNAPARTRVALADVRCPAEIAAAKKARRTAE
ncbi:MAG: patatin-like phospholipase family protein [Steroidobacteraceae bacterium]